MKAYPAYKESGIEWLGKIPIHFKLTRLGYESNVVDPQPDHRAPAIDENGLPYIGIRDVNQDGTVNIETARKIVEAAVTQQEQSFTIDDGDIVFCKVGTLGFPRHIIKPNIRFGLSATLVLIKVYNTNDSRFIKYMLESNHVNNQVNLEATGSTRQALGIQIIRKFSLVKTGLSEQQAIADFLDRKTAQIDTLIEKKQRQIDLLQEQRTALINHAVTKGLNPDVRMKDSGVEWLGEIPSHWKVVKLKYIGKAFIGLTYNPENVTDEENGTLVFRASNVQDGKIVFDDNVYVKMEIPERLITKVGDILICVRSGSRDLIGKNALIDEKSAGHAFGAFMTVFRSDINYFLSYVFKSQLFKVQSGIFNTSTVNQLTQGNLYDFQVAIPPIDEQEEIIQFLNRELTQIDETVNRVSTQIELLQEYRTALISEAVTGKIDVRTAETVQTVHE